jgi:nicotinamide mononucleotide transporter
MLVLGAWQQWLPLTLVEVFGFITGGLCVWLLVRQHILNWPIGIANNIFFAILFWRARLYGDMGLQFIYMALAFLGWYRWLYGGEQHGRLHVSKAPPRVLALVAAGIALGTVGLRAYLQSVGGSAPFLDALTTCMSIAAQYMLTRKYIENWLLWIVVDVLYVGLYAGRDLYLTAVLYVIFLLMCIEGWRTWRRDLGMAPTGTGEWAESSAK